jgi:hypothetical protein
MRRLALASLFAVALLGMVARPSAATYSFTASGIWHSSDGLLSGPWTAHFDVAGFDLTGTMDVIGLPGIAQGNISGSWDLDNIGFGVMFLNQEVLTFTGGLQGNQLVGTFDTGDILGDWSGSLADLSFSADPIESIVGTTIPTLVLNQISGQLGDIVNLIAKLYTLGAPIISTDNIINFDSLLTPILAKLDGTPDCNVNPTINASALFKFLPLGCSGSACTQVQAIIQSLTNSTTIPDGAALYTCKVQIAAQAATGVYQMVISALRAIDVNNLSLPVTSIAGSIIAKVKGWFGGCHCSIAETSGWLPLPSLVAPLALMVLRRRARVRTAPRS